MAACISALTVASSSCLSDSRAAELAAPAAGVVAAVADEEATVAAVSLLSISAEDERAEASEAAGVSDLRLRDPTATGGVEEALLLTTLSAAEYRTNGLTCAF